MTEYQIKAEVMTFIGRMTKFAATMPLEMTQTLKVVKKFKTASGGFGAAVELGGKEYVFKCESNGDMSVGTWVDGKNLRVLRKAASAHTTAHALCTEFGIN